MPREMTVIVHVIAEDGLPDKNDESLSGRVAFIFDGCIVSGWHLLIDPNDRNSPYSGYWEADEDVGRKIKFGRVTHWVEFPEPVWEIERQPECSAQASPPAAR